MSATNPEFIKRVVKRYRQVLAFEMEAMGWQHSASVFRLKDSSGVLVADHEITNLEEIEPILTFPNMCQNVLINGSWDVVDNDDEVIDYNFNWYPWEQYLEDIEAIEVHRDDYGVLYKSWPTSTDRYGSIDYDSVITVVKVVDSTPQPDGTFKDYYLRVPPEMTSARQAVAWTFGFENEREYFPLIET